MKRIYSIRDTKAETYSNPHLYRNDGEVVRDLRAMLGGDADNMMVAHPEDFQLFCLGSYDEFTGSIESQPPEHVANFIDLKTMETPD